MARHPINDKNGKATEYYWNDKHSADPEKASVFKKAVDGVVKKMKGVTFNSKSGKITKD
jgi:hypothetical protein